MEKRIDASWVAGALPRRAQNAHKGTLGTLNILAGSSRYRGAALLAAEGALRAGAGLVRLASIECVCAAAAVRLPACLLQPLPEAGGGIAPEGLEDVLAGKPTALLAGSGMGNTAATAHLVEGLLTAAPCPLVLDADALNALAGHLAEGPQPALRRHLLARLAACPQPVVLTPHMGEMARLSGVPVAQLAPRQAAAALEFATRHGCTLVLKSHVTTIATPEGAVYINDGASNPGLARGGSGDVLAGIIASLLAQGNAPGIAGAAGVWLHAAAGDEAACLYGQAGLSPADLPLMLAGVWKKLNY